MKAHIIHKLKETQKFLIRYLKTEWIIFVSDLLVSLLCLYVTLRILLGKDFQTLQMSFILKHCFVFAFISFGLFSWMASHHGASRYTSMEKIPTILGCALLANLFYHPLMLLMGNLPPLTPILNTVLFMIGLLLPRLLAPFWKPPQIKTHCVELSPKIPVIVVGYNEQIGAYLRSTNRNASKKETFPYHFMGILLNQPLTTDDLTPPFPILGMVDDFVSIVQKLSLEGRDPKRFLITQDSLNHLRLRQVLLKFQGRGILSLRFEVSPPSHEITLRPLQMENLLGKANLNNDDDPSQNCLASPAWQDIQSIIDSSRVLLTGVCDPVIHQLAHCIAGFYPKHLIMMDPSERALAALKLKFDQLYPDVRCDYVLASTTNYEILDQVIKDNHPQIVFHGDRVSHPGLMAHNLEASVEKNITSCLYFAKAIQKNEGRLFVLINAKTSTPVSQMIAALISKQIQSIDTHQSPKTATRFLVINSPDVWNNLDSMSAFWMEHLNQGLEITLPTPDTYSYILSAEESAHIILKASVKALKDEKTRGQILHLSGGEPFRLLDLLQSLALLHGLIPEIDVKTTFSGKESPSLSLETTDLFHPFTPGIVLSDTSLLTYGQDETLLKKLSEFIEKGKTVKIVDFLKKINHEYDQTLLPLKLAG